nr:hypothetical protein [Tanacetum cinerariifolium]
MAGLIPTISSVVNELVSSVVTDEAKSSGLGMVKEHVGYFLRRDENVEKMKKEVEKLRTMRGAVGQQIIGAKHVNRYSCGKRAALMSLSLMEHQVRGKGYETCVSVMTPPPGRLDVYENKNLDDIVTHKSCLEHIIKAIEDESEQIVGIYGLGGVGKTTLAMEVNERVKNLFDVVAFTTVSQTVSVEKIKDDLEVARKGIDQGE